MTPPRFCLLILSWLALLSLRADVRSTALPDGVEADWTLSRAYRETTPTRDRVCINGLWRWQPAQNESAPTNNWGFFKVPGAWPGITDYMQKDCQTLFTHDAWRQVPLATIKSAWYEREVEIPAEWHDREIVLTAEYVNSLAAVFVDGQRAGELRFPAGEVDLTALCRPGRKHWLTLSVTALPLKAVLLSYTDSASAREVKGDVPRRGLCGDVFLEGRRRTERIQDVRVTTSVQRGEIQFRAELEGLKPGHSYQLRAKILGNSDEEPVLFTSARFAGEQLHSFTLTNPWRTTRLWDIHTPTNQYSATLTLLDQNGAELDHSAGTRFGFRELSIKGRDFYLNGTRIFLSAVPLDNAQVGAAWSTYSAARESLERLKSFGINFVYTHNYGCEPGSHLSFADILRAADDVGILVALSQPHFSHYEWKSGDADKTNGYASHARFYAQVAGNHPSVVFYSMSHNATGYSEDMNPDLIGIGDAPRDQWASRNAALALRAEQIVEQIDSSRIVYHHASGNLGSMHPMNFYPNFVPIQELSDWFGPWAAHGTKPAFLCEYGAPFTWDWTMYRGWYNGQREFGSAKVPWEFCLAEWNAQFVGDRAYDLSNAEKANLRWEAKQFRAGNLWHRWDYPFPVGSDRFEERYPVFASYLTDNWRAFRGWGVSAVSPWEYEHFWKVRNGVQRSRTAIPVDWQNLQRPGYSPDYIAARYERMDLAFDRSDWIATPAAAALIRNNGPLLAFIAGPSSAFTAKEHNFTPGEKIEKQLIVINNSRERTGYEAHWSLALPQPATGTQSGFIETGNQVRVPLVFDLPPGIAPGAYTLRSEIRFANGDTQQDAFEIHVLRPHTSPAPTGKIALFDPLGETEQLLHAEAIPFSHVTASEDLTPYALLIVGKDALTLTNAAPDIRQVRSGMKVIVFEQSSAVLERRFGFRVVEYGLRQVFPRVPDHPILAGLAEDHLRDWRGDATLVPSRLSYAMRPRYGPTVRWCDLPVTRVWRCGNRGNLASVLIEKPAKGDFLPILDGGYSLQFSPLLEYHEGSGLVLFCQLDLTGRTARDPAAHTLFQNLLRYVSAWKPEAARQVLYAGSKPGRDFLNALGLSVDPGFTLSNPARQLAVLGPDAETALRGRESELASFVERGGRILAMDFASPNKSPLIPEAPLTQSGEHIGSYFSAPPFTSVLRGLSPADLHCREPKILNLIAPSAHTLGDGAVGCSADEKVVFFQIKPWEFDDLQKSNLKRSFRRTSFALNRLLANLGAPNPTPLLERFSAPVQPDAEKRWLTGLYLDRPEEWDDPYRFFRW